MSTRLPCLRSDMEDTQLRLRMGVLTEEVGGCHGPICINERRPIPSARFWSEHRSYVTPLKSGWARKLRHAFAVAFISKGVWSDCNEEHEVY